MTEREAPTPMHALPEEEQEGEKGFDAGLGEGPSLRPELRVERGLQMKGWACRSKPGSHVMTHHSYIQHGHTHLCSAGKDERYSKNSPLRMVCLHKPIHPSITIDPIRPTETSSLNAMIHLFASESSSIT